MGKKKRQKKPPGKRETQRRKAEAKRRAGIILKVRHGELTVTEAAEELGISRKTYYEWENRGLKGFMEALEYRGVGGRPATEPDPEKAALAAEIEKLKKEKVLLQRQVDIQKILASCFEEEFGVSKKKPPRKSKK